ncbi:unnamed protein product [Phytomonas sp. Hart1]|nr:unnamed protein product [Phytomonas sp. Hart1]|eukprot:CCW68319.1 unnamed protein product [Phytomonas sp. isolate Hart1]
MKKSDLTGSILYTFPSLSSTHMHTHTQSYSLHKTLEGYITLFLISKCLEYCVLLQEILIPFYLINLSTLAEIGL